MSHACPMVCTNHSLQTLFLQWNISDSINFETEGRRFPNLLRSRTFVVSRAMHDDPKNDCEGDYKRFPIKFDCRLCFVLKDSSVFEYVHVQ